MTTQPSQMALDEAGARPERVWRLLDNGYLLFLREHRLLVSAVAHRPEREYGRCEARLSSVELAVGAGGLGLGAGELLAMVDDSRAMHSVLDLCRGTLVSDPQGTLLLASEWSDFVSTHMDGELLDALHEHWLQAQGLRPREPHETGVLRRSRIEMLEWYALHPDSRADVYLDQGEPFLASEIYSVEPGGIGDKAIIDFSEPAADRDGPHLGSFFVSFPDLRLLSSDGPRERMERLWSAYRARHLNAGERLAARRRRMVEVAPPLAPPPEPHVSEPQISRNDPCPCGSGKKYKRCCGG